MGNRTLSDATNREIADRVFQKDTFQNDAFQIYDVPLYNLLTAIDSRTLGDTDERGLVDFGGRVVQQSVVRDTVEIAGRAIGAVGSQNFPWSFPLWFTTEPKTLTAPTLRSMA